MDSITEVKDRLAKAEAHTKLNELDSALIICNDVVELCQNNVTKLRGGEANSSLDAQTEWQRLLAVALNERGHTHYLQVGFDEAIKDYTSAIEVKGDLTVAFYNRGLVHYRLGRYGVAIPDMEKALQLDPSFTSAAQCLKQCQEDWKERDADLTEPLTSKLQIHQSPQEDETSGRLEEEQLSALTFIPNRILKTLALYVCFVAIGLADAVLGPTLVSMELLLQVNSKDIATCFICGSAGYTLGSVITGVIYERINHELLFGTSMTLLAVTMTSMPFTGSLYGFIFCAALLGFCCSFNDAGSQSYIITLWRGHRLKGAVMQALHLLFSVGATLGPFLVRPFLPDLVFLHSPCNQTTSAINSAQGQTAQINSTTSSWSRDTPEDVTGSNLSSDDAKTQDDEGQYHCDRTSHNLDLRWELSYGEIFVHISRVRFAYVTIGALISVSAVFFLITFLVNGPSLRNKDPKAEADVRGDEEEKKKNSANDPRFRIRFLTFGFLLFFLYLVAENTCAQYLASFVVKGLGWSNGHGALITSAFWGSLGVGRLLGVPLSVALTTTRMLLCDVTLMIVGAAVLLAAEYHVSVTWVGTIVAGFGMSTFFPTAMLWTAEHVALTGSTSAILLIASSLGSMAGPYLAGYLLDALHYMAVVYVVFISSVLTASVFLGATLFTRGQHQPRTRPQRSVGDDFVLEVKAPENQSLKDDVH